MITSSTASEPEHVYIGSYSDGARRPSFYDLITKQLSACKININLFNPSFVLPHKNLIYIVEQTQNGKLVTIDNQYNLKSTLPTQGNDPCHICINNSATRLVVTNYSSGSFAVYELAEDGLPKKLMHFVMHKGHGKNTDRQEGPHPHCSVFSECDRYLFVADLGTDTVYFYEISPHEAEGIKCLEEKCLKMDGCGPRHLKVLPGQEVLILAGQLDSTIRMISYKDSGPLTLLAAYRVSQNPSNYPSQIKYYNGNIFMACRGDNYLIIFDIYEEHKLKQKFRFKVGEWPRHFNISPAGMIYVACQFENTVQRYRWDKEKVYQVGSLKISCPSCVNFLE